MDRKKCRIAANTSKTKPGGGCTMLCVGWFNTAASGWASGTASRQKHTVHSNSNHQLPTCHTVLSSTQAQTAQLVQNSAQNTWGTAGNGTRRRNPYMTPNTMNGMYDSVVRVSRPVNKVRRKTAKINSCMTSRMMGLGAGRAGGGGAATSAGAPSTGAVDPSVALFVSARSPAVAESEDACRFDRLRMTGASEPTGPKPGDVVGDSVLEICACWAASTCCSAIQASTHKHDKISNVRHLIIRLHLRSCLHLVHLLQVHLVSDWISAGRHHARC
jgi:hypothetical protein